MVKVLHVRMVKEWITSSIIGLLVNLALARIPIFSGYSHSPQKDLGFLLRRREDYSPRFNKGPPFLGIILGLIERGLRKIGGESLFQPGGRGPGVTHFGLA